MKQWLKKISPKKVLTCNHCQTKFRFPVKPGKTLSVTCPKCRTSYQVSFVNPLKELVKGQLKWGALNPTEKKKLVIMLVTLLLCLGLIVSSVLRPIKPKGTTEKALVHVI
tara:strand:+ start:848 stop:1177 length:330 start_codon:yes stop_codon:yes gene_type:complete